MIYKICSISDIAECDISDVYSALNDSQKQYIDKKPDEKRIQSLGARKLLSDILGKECLPFIGFDRDGRPHVLPDGRFFSLSHSGGLVAAAVSDIPVGIDVQLHRPISSRLINRVCTKQEAEHINVLGNKAFFEIWTAKEAYVKCYGVSFAEAKKICFITNGRICPNDPQAEFFAFSNDKYSYSVISSKKQR